MNRIVLAILSLILITFSNLYAGNDTYEETITVRHALELEKLPSYINDSHVKLVAPENYLDSFWESLEDNAVKNYPDSALFSVLHLGDSHIQAGFFTEPLRTFFSDRFGFGGLGWVAPYRLARSNSPSTYSITCNFRNWNRANIVQRNVVTRSPGGIKVWHNQRGAIEVSISDKCLLGSGFDRVIAYRPQNHSAIVPSTNFKTPYKMYGGPVLSDNIGLWADSIYLEDVVKSIFLRIPSGTHWFGSQLLYTAGGVVVHTVGLNGATFKNYVENKSGRLLTALAPDLIIISMGTNEAVGRNFSESDMMFQVRSLVESIQASAPNCLIILTSPVYSFRRTRNRNRRVVYSKNLHIEKVKDAIKRVANEKEVGFIDLYEAFGGEKGRQQLLDRQLLSRDRIHLTKEGYWLSGKVLVNALKKDYNRWLYDTINNDVNNLDENN